MTEPFPTEELRDKKGEKREKVRRVFIYIGVFCLIALLVIIPLSIYIVR